MVKSSLKDNIKELSKKSNSQHSIFSFYKTNLNLYDINNNESNNDNENKERRLSKFVEELEKRYEDDNESKDNRIIEILVRKT